MWSSLLNALEKYSIIKSAAVLVLTISATVRTKLSHIPSIDLQQINADKEKIYDLHKRKFALGQQKYIPLLYK